MSIEYESEERYKMFINGDYDKVFSDKRIMKDLVEINQNLKDLDTVIALPLRNNIYEWHGNIKGQGKYEKGVFHIRIIFSTTYPIRPPRVELLTSLPEHEHIYGNWICVDLLQTHSNYDLSEEERKYTGWNSGYSILSILKNLQLFFFSEEHSGERIRMDKNQLKTSKKVVVNTLRYGCSCGHDMKKRTPWPWKKEWAIPHENEAVLFYDTYLSRTRRERIEKKFQMRKENAERRRELSTTSSSSINTKKKKKKKRSINGIHTKYHLPEPLVPLSIHSLSGVPSDLLTIIFSYLGRIRRKKKKKKKKNQMERWYLINQSSLSNIKATCRRFACVIDQPLSLPFPVFCYHSKQGITEDIIGYGITCKRKRNGKTGMILSSSWDFVSLESFEKEKIRLDSTKSPFTYFFPLYLSKKYGKKSAKYFKRTCMLLTKPPEPPKKKLLKSEIEKRKEKEKKMSYSDFERERMEKERVENERWRKDHLQFDLYGYSFQDVPKSYFNQDEVKFTLEMGVNVVTKMMKSIVVTIMNNNIHASMKALDAYLHVYRWFCALVLEPSNNNGSNHERYLKIINTKVGDFINKPFTRHKKHTPDLGDFLALCSLSTDYSYRDIMLPVVEETLTRNVLWIIKKYKDYGNIIYSTSGRVGKEEMRQAWEASQVGLKLLCFNAFFLRNLKCSNVNEIRRKCRKLDEKGGFSDESLKMKLQQTIFRIQQQMDNYKSFFYYIYIGMDRRRRQHRRKEVEEVEGEEEKVEALEPPSMKMVGKWLKKAVFYSIHFRYHRHKYVKGRKIIREGLGKKLTMMKVSEIEKNVVPDDFSKIRRNKKRIISKGGGGMKKNAKKKNMINNNGKVYANDPNYKTFTKIVYNTQTTDAGTTVIKIEKKRVRVRKGRKSMMYPGPRSKKNNNQKGRRTGGVFTQKGGSNKMKKKMMKKKSTQNNNQGGRVFKVYEANKNRKFGDVQYQVFVANIPYDTEIEDIHEVFRGVGRIVNINYLSEKGVAFVEFFEEKEQKKAIKELNETLFNGRIMYVRDVKYDKKK